MRLEPADVIMLAIVVVTMALMWLFILK